MNWVIKDPIKDSLNFQKHNLIGAWEELGTFDLILIRDVLTYFPLETQQKLHKSSSLNSIPAAMSSLVKMRYLKGSKGSKMHPSFATKKKVQAKRRATSPTR